MKRKWSKIILVMILLVTTMFASIIPAGASNAQAIYYTSSGGSLMQDTLVPGYGFSPEWKNANGTQEVQKVGSARKAKYSSFFTASNAKESWEDDVCYAGYYVSTSGKITMGTTFGTKNNQGGIGLPMVAVYYDDAPHINSYYSASFDGPFQAGARYSEVGSVADKPLDLVISVISFDTNYLRDTNHTQTAGQGYYLSDTYHKVGQNKTTAGVFFSSAEIGILTLGIKSVTLRYDFVYSGTTVPFSSEYITVDGDMTTENQLLYHLKFNDVDSGA